MSATETQDKIAIVCCDCGKSKAIKPTSKGNPRVPQGWKRTPDDRLHCDRCWKSAYVLRAITFPVAGPVDGTWDELRDSLSQAWAASTGLANWAQDKLYANDVRRTPDAKKMPAMPTVYLYGLGPEFHGWDQLGKTSAQAILKTVEAKYRAKRYEIAWTGNSTVPNYRYPFPLPVPAANWSASKGNDNEPIVSLPISGKRWTLRLRGGNEFRRQLAAFRRFLDGSAITGEAAIYRVKVQETSHRPEATVHTRVMVKLVGWFPKRAKPDRSGDLIVKTCDDALLVAVNEKDERLWWINADHVRGWQAAHSRRLQRLAEDRKHESRRPSKRRQRRAGKCGKLATKNQNRLDSFLHETAAALAGYADRRGFARVIYNDHCRTYYSGNFPWYMLAQRINEKLDAVGIDFVASSGEVAQ